MNHQIKQVERHFTGNDPVEFLDNSQRRIHTASKTEPRRIGFVTVWFERGQAYVTKTIRDALSRVHKTFVFARTGRVYGKRMLEETGFWHVPDLTRFDEYEIPSRVIQDWIADNDLDIVVFNEEYDWNLVKVCKETGVKILTYLDYYEENWKPSLQLYDAVLCSTQRTYNLVKAHCSAHFIGWAVDTELFKPQQESRPEYTFFHNAGWLGINFRKMTPATIVAFDIVSKLFPEATLLVHAQAGIDQLPEKIVKIIRNNPRITYHVGTLPAPGLYHKGRILVFPSKLEGLGLPLLEGLSCGLPAVATDAPPMNEFVKDGENGLLVRASITMDRGDTIAFPEHIVEVKDLAYKMATLVRDPERIKAMSKKARQFAHEVMNLQTFGRRLSEAVISTL